MSYLNELVTKVRYRFDDADNAHAYLDTALTTCESNFSDEDFDRDMLQRELATAQEVNKKLTAALKQLSTAVDDLEAECPEQMDEKELVELLFETCGKQATMNHVDEVLALVRSFEF